MHFEGFFLHHLSPQTKSWFLPPPPCPKFDLPSVLDFSKEGSLINFLLEREQEKEWVRMRKRVNVMYVHFNKIGPFFFVSPPACFPTTHVSTTPSLFFFFLPPPTLSSRMRRWQLPSLSPPWITVSRWALVIICSLLQLTPFFPPLPHPSNLCPPDVTLMQPVAPFSSHLALASVLCLPANWDM